jgi:hypothetical protein
MTNLVVPGVLENAGAVADVLDGREGPIPAGDVLEAAGLFERYPMLQYDVAPELGWLDTGFFLTAPRPDVTAKLPPLPPGQFVVSRIPFAKRVDALAVPDDLGPEPVVTVFQRIGDRLSRFTVRPQRNFAWAASGGSCCGEAVGDDCESNLCGTCKRVDGLAGGVTVTVCVCEHDLDGAVR